MLLVGEVHTALLQNSLPVQPAAVRRLLELRSDEAVRISERPIGHAVSPEIHAGVDCRIASGSGRRLRGVGTVATQVVVTGSRIVQGSTYAHLARADSDRRLPWSHYLSAPGRIEITSSKVDWNDIGTGFLDQDPGDALNLGAVSDSAMDEVQQRAELDNSPPFVSRRTALRWILAKPAAEGPRAEFTITSAKDRILRLALAAEPAAVVRLCEDLALHDWLLTTVIDLVERSHRSTDQARMIEPLRLAVEHLIHLWLPGAHVAETLLPIWDGFEKRPGFSRQWEVTVNRIRDLVAVTTVGLLRAAAAATPDVPPVVPMERAPGRQVTAR
jgi:hypothetical protein